MFNLGARQRQEALDKNTKVQLILEEIARAFLDNNLTFKRQIEHSKFVLSTTPSFSGGFIEIKHYLADDYMIELRHSNLPDAKASSDQHARAAIHQRIVMSLIYMNGSSDRRYFLRQNIFKLKDAGIKEFVDGLVRLHKKYDSIWFLLESHGIRERLSTLLEHFSVQESSIMGELDLVLGKSE